MIVAREGAFGKRFEALRPYIADELNAWDVTVTSDEASWCEFSALPNNQTLGKRAGKAFGALRAAVLALDPADVAKFAGGASLTVAGHTLSGDDLLVKKSFKGDAASYEAASSDDGALMVVIDTRQDAKVIAQARAREVLNRVQKLRKKAELDLSDEVDVFFDETLFPWLPADQRRVADAMPLAAPPGDDAATPLTSTHATAPVAAPTVAELPATSPAEAFDRATRGDHATARTSNRVLLLFSGKQRRSDGLSTFLKQRGFDVDEFDSDESTQPADGETQDLCHDET